MEQNTQIWLVIALSVYLIVWYVLVQVFKMMAPADEKEWKDYTVEHGIPYINISDMIVGIAALWVLWIAVGILWLAYWLIKKIVTFVIDIFA